MKKIILITLIVITGIYSCKKGSEIITSDKNNTLPKNLKPISLPTFVSMNEINDQVRALAYSLASITDNTYMANDNPTEYKSLIEDQLENNSDEVTFGELNTNINMGSVGVFTNVGGTTPSNFKSLVEEAILFQSPWYLGTSPRSWGMNSYSNDGYEGFIYNNTQYNTLVRIPELDQNRHSKPFIVIPNEVDVNGDLLLPIIGYTFNFATDEVDVVSFATEEDLDVDDNYYIWVVDYAPIPVQTTNPTQGCTGDNAPLQNDGFCDFECGENESNSFNDCNPQFIKKVWISDIEISEDYKQRCGTNYQWNESRIQGQYELGYSSLVVHGSGKVKPYGGFINHRWKRNEVEKTKKLLVQGCNFNSKGTSSYKAVKNIDWWDNSIESRWTQKDEALQPRCFFSENYKPSRDTIYFFVFEEDIAPNNIRTQTIQYRPGQSATIQFFSRNNEGPWGDKKMQSAYTFYGSIQAVGPMNQSPTGHVIMITPQSWPGLGTSFNDEFEIFAVISNSGANANTRSIKLKIKYDQF
jgi:hypothetical protein